MDPVTSMGWAKMFLANAFFFFQNKGDFSDIIIK